MIKPLRILIADDDSRWQNLLSRILSGMGGQVEIVPATDYENALVLIRHSQFNLAVLDLRLPGNSISMEEVGFQLAKDIRASAANRACALVMLTAYPTRARFLRAMIELDISDFLEKDDFDQDLFIQRIKSALLDAQMSQALQERERKHILTFEFKPEYLRALHWVGPSRRLEFPLAGQTDFAPLEFANRCDRTNLFLAPPLRSEHKERWKPEARSIGQDLYRELARHPDVLAALTSVRTIAETSSDVWLYFRGPRNYLGVPFGLLKDGDDYLALTHPIQVQVKRTSAAPSHKTELFHDFIDRLNQRKQKLRILLVASNLPPRIDAVDQEVRDLQSHLEILLTRVGLPHEIDTICSMEATLDRIHEVLNRCRYHIVHYAGHGRYDDDMPDRSGIYLNDNGKRHLLQADALKTLLQGSETRLLFLSCCLGARTSERIGQGDFLGIMDAIVQADVPTVIGYRWDVSDKGAHDLALAFYDNLFFKFSVEDSLFEARKELAIKRGRDDETWASPVLVAQNS